MMHKDQFTAIGPSNTGAGFSRAAFSTKGNLAPPSRFTHGVNVEGTECGVYGNCEGGPGRTPGHVGVGLWGDGLVSGVHGRGNVGVRGEGRSAGVEGESDKGP